MKDGTLRASGSLNRIAPKADFVFDWKFLTAVTFLLLVMWELHELVHILTGYLYCGDFGFRDFNVWGLADACASTNVPTFLGPVFTFGIGYIAIILLFSRSAKWRAFGIALFWAANPITRLITLAIFGGGDEAVGLYRSLSLSDVEDGFKLAERVALVILCLASWPLLAGLYYKLPRRTWLWIPIFLIAPFLTAMAVLLAIYTPLHKLDFLSGPGFAGGSMMVTLVFLFNLVMCGITIKWLFRVPNHTQSIEHD